MSSGTLKVALWIPGDIASMPEGRQPPRVSSFNIYTDSEPECFNLKCRLLYDFFF